MAETVVGKKMVVHFDGKRCIHSRACVLGRPDVFVPNVEGEWIFPDRATPAELLELAHNCPSGAIRVEPVDAAAEPDAIEAPPVVNVARVRENGPLAVHAEATIAGTSCLRATLCRCGASQNKPYCDGSHTAVGFTATGEPATTPSDALPVRNGALAIVPAPDGPLLCTGPLEVVSGTGRTVARVGKTALCRCGQSGNKPYCDGSHRAAGFRG